MNDHEKSHPPVVPAKHRNKAAGAVADGVEGRGGTKGNLAGQNTHRTQSRASVTSALGRVREAARRDRTMKFTSLLHHVTVERLRSAYGELNRGAAVGIDGMTWTEYGRRLDQNLIELHDRVHRGAYRPQAGRRVFIAKADGTRRPLAIVSMEDKIVQRAVNEVLNAIYEEDFYGFCHGFRPRRGTHDALDALSVALQRKRVNWVLDADIQSFFDTMGHEWLRKFLEHRIGDQRVIRLILKWLKAGVMEDGEWTASEEGSPQGGTISPLLANVYLFYAFDQWAHRWRKKVATGDVVIVRYADDFVVGFERREEAEKFQAALSERLGKFGLKLHPKKTRILEFGRYAAERREKRGERKPETFTFLGLTHICATDRKGRFAVKRVTSQKRMTRKLHELREELIRRRHDPIPEQGKWLRSVIRGFDAYHGVPGNIDALSAFRKGIFRLWRQALSRRSQNGTVSVERMARVSTRWFPAAKVVHPWPEQRFDAKTQGRNRMR
ncbi:MAG TPA: group II intron reverse transcriptase/maturase [Thermoanaerobaculia bacterium]|nr:group II intron reverse transcriptase/maturase [Thermoanaerobaculia bacterium]